MVITDAIKKKINYGIYPNTSGKFSFPQRSETISKIKYQQNKVALQIVQHNLDIMFVCLEKISEKNQNYLKCSTIFTFGEFI